MSERARTVTAGVASATAKPKGSRSKIRVEEGRRNLRTERKTDESQCPLQFADANMNTTLSRSMQWAARPSAT